MPYFPSQVGPLTAVEVSCDARVNRNGVMVDCERTSNYAMKDPEKIKETLVVSGWRRVNDHWVCPVCSIRDPKTLRFQKGER
jgi:rubredoxin